MEKLKELRDNILNRLKSHIAPDMDTSTGSFISDILTTLAMELEKIYTNVINISRKFDFEQLAGDELDEFIGNHSPVERKKATYASGIVTITGEDGAIVPDKTMVSSEYLDFLVQGEHVIDKDNTIDVPVICNQIGKVGNVREEAIYRFPVAVEGLVSVTNKKAFDNGFNEETDESFKQRYLDYMRLPITSGNKAHYEYWAKEVDGVGAAYVEPLWNGAGTVKVSIVDSNGEVPSDELLQATQNHIDPNKNGDGSGQAPIGAQCIVSKIVGVGITITVSIILNKVTGEDVDTDRVTDEILREINEYFVTEAAREKYVSYNKVSRVILNHDRVYDHNKLLLNGKTENIDIDGIAIPVLDEERSVIEYEN